MHLAWPRAPQGGLGAEMGWTEFGPGRANFKSMVLGDYLESGCQILHALTLCPPTWSRDPPTRSRDPSIRSRDRALVARAGPVGPSIGGGAL